MNRVNAQWSLGSGGKNEDVMKINLNITESDFKAFTNFHINKTRKIKSNILTYISCIIIGILYGIYGDKQENLVQSNASVVTGVMACIILFLVIFIISLLKTISNTTPQKEGFLLGPKSLNVENNELIETTEHYKGIWKINTLVNIEEDKKYYLVMVDNMAGLIIPKNTMDCEEFISELRSVQKA